MSMPQPPIGPRQTSPLQHHVQLAQTGTLNPVSLKKIHIKGGVLCDVF